MSGKIARASLRTAALAGFLGFLTTTAIADPPTITGAFPSVVATGDPITFAGSGFDDETEVLFVGNFDLDVDDDSFGVAGELVERSSTEIVVVPPGLRVNLNTTIAALSNEDGMTVSIPDDVPRYSAANPPRKADPFLVIEAGETLPASFGWVRVVFVESGAVLGLQGWGETRVALKSGAVLDLTDVTLYERLYVIREPGALVVGEPEFVQHPIEYVDIPALKFEPGGSYFFEGQRVTITTVGGGSVTVTPEASAYAFEEVVTCTAAPDEGHVFVGWTGDRESSDPVLSLRILGRPINLTATFNAGFLLDRSASVGGSLTASPDQAGYTAGTEVTLTATADPGYEFVGWLGDVAGTDPSITLTMDDSLKVRAGFRPTSAPTGPLITGADRFAVPFGETITLSGGGFTGATAVHTIHDMEYYDAQFEVVSDSELKFDLPSYAGSVREHALLLETPQGCTVTLGGEIEWFAALGPLEEDFGPDVVVTAGAVLTGDVWQRIVFVEAGGVLAPSTIWSSVILAADGAVLDFSELAPNGLGASDIYYGPGTIIEGELPQDPLEISRYFEVTSLRPSLGLGPFVVGGRLDLTVVGGGTVELPPGAPFYPQNERITLTAVPDDGHQFSGWSGAITSQERTIEIGMDPVVALTATFAEGWLLEQYVSAGGTVAVEPEGPIYQDGTVVTLTAQADPGFTFAGWGGDAAGAGTSAQVTMDANRRFVSAFRADSYTALPQITGADSLVAPTGEDLAIGGSALGGLSAAAFVPPGGDLPLAVEFQETSASALEVTVPAVSRADAEFLLLVEAAAGSTVALPPGAVDIAGSADLGVTDGSVVVAAPGTLVTSSQNQGFGLVVYLQSGAVLAPQGISYATVFVEDGATVDFSKLNFGHLAVTTFYHAPGAVFLGEYSENSAMVEFVEVPPLRLSRDVGPFGIGVRLETMAEGPGSVTVDPAAPFYRYGDEVALTAVPDPGNYFVRWTQTFAGRDGERTLRIYEDISVTARFTDRPDYYTDWRLRHFTPDELADPAVSGLHADPNGNGLTNAADYVLGLDPRASGGAPPYELRVAQIGGESRVVLVYRRPANAVDVEYKILVSEDASTWHHNGDGSGTVYTEEVSAVDVGNDTEEVTVVLYAGTQAPGQVFVRIDAAIEGLE